MLLAEPRSSVAATASPSSRRWLGPGWPLAALLCLYPVWWVIGIGQFAFILFAVPMVRELWRRRPLSLPPGFGLWLLFLGWNLLSLVMLPFAAPNTTAGSVGGRLISILVQLVELGAVTVILLYVSTLSLDRVPQQRLLRWLSIMCLVTVAGGVLGMVAPHVEFTSPVEAVLPHGIRSNYYALTFVHPNAAQVQDVLGYAAPRPAAPWSYTNFWGNNLSILLVWFCIYRGSRRAARERLWSIGVVVVALVTIVYSLNRGVWFGILISVGFVVLALAARGDVRAALAVLAIIPVVVISFLLTPLHSVVEQRASHGTSNDIRHFLDAAAYHGALDSPVLGWGGTRKAIGSAQSIAVGPSANCPSCGAISIGSTGQIWAVMFDQGLVGAALYIGFFLAVLWGLRGDRTLIGSGTRLVLVLGIFYTVFYENLPSALAFTMISIGMSWRGVVAASRQPAVTA